VKGKAFHVTGRGNPCTSETSRVPLCPDNQLIAGGEVVSLKHRRPECTLRKILGTLLFERDKNILTGGKSLDFM
jgi:hypothetical protein